MTSVFEIAEGIAAYTETLQNHTEQRLEKYNWDSASGRTLYIKRCREYIKSWYCQEVSAQLIEDTVRDKPSLSEKMPRSRYPQDYAYTNSIQLDDDHAQPLSAVELENGVLEVETPEPSPPKDPRDELQSAVELAIYDEALRVQAIVRTELAEHIKAQDYMQHSCAERNYFYAVLSGISYQLVAELDIIDELCLDYPYARSQADHRIPYFTAYIAYTPVDDPIQMAAFYFRFISDPRALS